MVESETEPTIRRWQDGHEIPVGATLVDVTDPQTGATYQRWRYRRVVTPALTASDITEAVARQHDADPLVLAAALTAAGVGTLAVDRWSIPADGIVYAVASYPSVDPVRFVVDGTVVTVVPVNGVATLQVAADAPGVIRIRVHDQTAVIVAEGIT